MKTVVNKNGTVHEIVMAYYDGENPLDDLDIYQIVDELYENKIYSNFLIDPKIFDGNENYIVASNDLDDLDENISKIENVKSQLSPDVKGQLETILEKNIPRYPRNPENRYISVFVASYPNISIKFEVHDSKFNAEKLVYSTSRLYKISDIIFNTMDKYEFLNAVIYAGELVDIKIGEQIELDGVEFFIYDTKTKSRVVEKSGILEISKQQV